LDHHDCELQPTMELRRSLVRVIREHKPEVVICGDADAWFYEYSYINHPDHRAAAQAAIEAVFPCAEMELLWPELGPVHKVHAVYISGQREANVFVDITETMDDKVAALRSHVSQMGDWDPGDMVRRWAASDAERVRQTEKAARKAAKKAAKQAAKQGGPAPDAAEPAAAPRKPRFVEGYRVMVLKQDDVSY
jgi:LmbE family N-acetylglucosaminyl deacetylase